MMYVLDFGQNSELDQDSLKRLTGKTLALPSWFSLGGNTLQYQKVEELVRYLRSSGIDVDGFGMSCAVLAEDYRTHEAQTIQDTIGIGTDEYDDLVVGRWVDGYRLVFPNLPQDKAIFLKALIEPSHFYVVSKLPVGPQKKSA